VAPDLVGLLELGSAAYRRFVKNSALSRASRRTLQRNAAVALGNTDSSEAVAPLIRALDSDHALVRGHAAWALGQLMRHDPPTIRQRLAQLQAGDPETWVREEATLAARESSATPIG
jgi:epoxyqueuosine reductase